MQRLITSGKWSMRNSGTLYRELPNKGNSSYTYYVQGCPGWKMSLVPVSCPVNHVEICPRGVSLLFKKKGDREARRSLLFPPPSPSRVREGSCTYVSSTLFSTVPKTYVRYVSHIRGWEGTRVAASTWPAIGRRGGENSPLSYGTADRIRRRRDYNFQEEGLLEAFSKEQVPVNSIASRISFAEYFLQRFEEFLLFNTSFLIGRSCSWITRGGGYWFRCDSICICIPWSPSSIRSMRTENCSFDSSRSCCRCCCACSGGGWDVILSVEICRKQSVMV